MMRRAAASPAWAAETVINNSTARLADPNPYRDVIAPCPDFNSIYGACNL
jgi:hypothetical protein